MATSQATHAVVIGRPMLELAEVPAYAQGLLYERRRYAADHMGSGSVAGDD